MKASSCGIEVNIYDLNEEESLEIGRKGIKGLLNFRDVLYNKPEIIPFELKCAELKNLIKVQLFPKKVYFGEAEKIIFFIDHAYYFNLLERGCAEGARFWTSGKLSLRRKDYYQKELNSLIDLI